MSIAEELQKLQTLRDRGAITEEEFAKAKAAVLDGAPARPTAAPAAGPVEHISDELHRLTRARHDAWLGGVCGGLGRHTPLPSWAWRALFLFLLLTFGASGSFPTSCCGFACRKSRGGNDTGTASSRRIA
jgi:phage shock protein PspC (stress-responsive transcriptional regulator)